MESSADSSESTSVLQINFNSDINTDVPPEAIRESPVNEKFSDENKKVSESLDSQKLTFSVNAEEAFGFQCKHELSDTSHSLVLPSIQTASIPVENLPVPINLVDDCNGSDSADSFKLRMVPITLSIPVTNGLVDKLSTHFTRVSSLESPTEWSGCEVSESGIVDTSQFREFKLKTKSSAAPIGGSVPIENKCSVAAKTSSAKCVANDVIKNEGNKQSSALIDNDSDRNLFLTMTRMKDSTAGSTRVINKSNGSDDLRQHTVVPKISRLSALSNTADSVANLIVSSANADECIAPFRGHVHHIPEAEDSTTAMQPTSLGTKLVGNMTASTRARSSRAAAAYSLRSTAPINSMIKVKGPTKRQSAGVKRETKPQTADKTKSKFQVDVPLQIKPQIEMENQEKVPTDVKEPTTEKVVTDVKCSTTVQPEIIEQTKSQNDGNSQDKLVIDDKSEIVTVVKVEPPLSEPASVGLGCTSSTATVVPSVRAVTVKAAFKRSHTKSNKPVSRSTPCMSVTVSSLIFQYLIIYQP